MPGKANRAYWIIIGIGAVLFFGVLIHSSLEATRKEYEVCMTFHGVTHCATAKGASYDEAVRTAQGIDCQLLANGRDENVVCLAQQPTSVRPIQ